MKLYKYQNENETYSLHLLPLFLYVCTEVHIFLFRLVCRTYSGTDLPKYQGLIQKYRRVQDLLKVTKFSYLNKIIFYLLKV